MLLSCCYRQIQQRQKGFQKLLCLVLIYEQNYIAEHLGISVPTKGKAQCLAPAFPKSIQSVSLDPGALRDYPPTGFYTKERCAQQPEMWGKNVSSVSYLNMLEMLEKQCLRDQMEMNMMSKNNCVVVWVASQSNSEKKPRTAGGRELV